MGGMEAPLGQRTGRGSPSAWAHGHQRMGWTEPSWRLTVVRCLSTKMPRVGVAANTTAGAMRSAPKWGVHAEVCTRYTLTCAPPDNLRQSVGGVLFALPGSGLRLAPFF